MTQIISPPEAATPPASIAASDLETQIVEQNQVAQNQVAPASDERDGVRVWKWTRESYSRAIADGWFEGRRVELMDGEIEEMAAMLGPHARGTSGTSGVLTLLFGIENYSIRTQCPLDLGAPFQPEPDVAVVTREALNAAPALGHPSSALLVVEVSDSTLRRDQNAKMSLYASVLIPEYVLVNLPEDRVEVRTRPQSAPEALFGAAYATLNIYRRGETFSLATRPDAVLRVDDLFG